MFNKTNTLDGILSDFSKTITKLEALISKNTSKASSNEGLIDTLKYENEGLLSEANKAASVKHKLQDLIS